MARMIRVNLVTQHNNWQEWTNLCNNVIDYTYIYINQVSLFTFFGTKGTNGCFWDWRRVLDGPRASAKEGERYMIEIFSLHIHVSCNIMFLWRNYVRGIFVISSSIRGIFGNRKLSVFFLSLSSSLSLSDSLVLSARRIDLCLLPPLQKTFCFLSFKTNVYGYQRTESILWGFITFLIIAHGSYYLPCF